MVRLILCLIAVILFLILFIPVLILEWVLGKRRPDLRDISSMHIIHGIFRIVLFLAGVKVTVKGKEKIPRDQAVLYIANHRSIFDILVIYTQFQIPTSFIAKKELARIPLLASWMRMIRCLFLDRKDMRQGMKIILTAIDYIKEGLCVCIFPEGTRSKSKDESELLAFHEGSFRVATRTGCPIVPVSINNTASVFEDHLPFIRSAHVILEFLDPIYPAALSREEQKHLGEQTRQLIMVAIKKNHE